MRIGKTNRIAFITAVNNDDLYRQCVEHINALNIPKDMQIEIISIYNAESITKAYNQAQMQSNAKYKVYLHQDLMITDKEFITKVVDSFTAFSNVGIMGVVGCKKLPDNAIWWEDTIIGQFKDNHDGVMREYRYTTQSELQYADVLDGCILCTQYDIRWREDLFKGWHFYDVSQCYEYQIHGYNVAVLPIINPMTEHQCGVCNMNGYEEGRQIFIKNYMEG